ncbi:metalloregulator ArsR/SmtB family transcription factor [Actinoplanes couchii]|nr:metalloregulator ArsR/SmtB family transcription factor [Actinoplanes couchii]MDR6317625.1 DNA-binding transcriptional ArsR family regulator [Actinoplanes couchii]
MSDGVFAALAHPTRRSVLTLLQRNGPMAVGDIAAALGVVGPTLSGHLKILRGADLVDTQRQGTTIRYVTKLSVLEGAIADLMENMRLGATGDVSSTISAGREHVDGND